MTQEQDQLEIQEQIDGEQMAKNIWLAGLGVYHKSLEEAQQVEGKAGNLFEELVAEGREVEAQTREKISKEAAEPSMTLEARVQQLFSRLSGIEPNRLKDLNAKVDRLTDIVNKLADE